MTMLSRNTVVIRLIAGLIPCGKLAGGGQYFVVKLSEATLLFRGFMLFLIPGQTAESLQVSCVTIAPVGIRTFNG